MAITQNLTHWPIWVSQFGTVTDESLDDHLATALQVVERDEPYAAIVTTPKFVESAARAGFLSMSGAQRKRLAEFGKTYKESHARNCKGAAFVMPTSSVRGLLTAIFWLQRPAFPHKVFADLEEAWEWSEGRLHQAGVAVPPRPDALFKHLA